MMRKGKACSSTTAAEEASISKSSKSGATSLGSGGGLKVKKGPWSAEEDELLKTFILSQQSGKVGGWRTVPRRAGLLRCGKSCRLRWMNYLRPNLKRGVFSPDEDDLILRLHRLLGNRWALIAGRIPGRTDNEIKNYWNSHLSKNNKNFSESHNPNPNPPLLPLNLSAPSPASSTVHVQANPLHIHSNSVNTNSTSNTAIDRDHHNNHLQQSHVPYSSNSVVTETRRCHLQYNHYHPPSPNFPSSDHYLSFHHINNMVSNNYNNNTTASIELQQATWSVATSTSNNNNHHVPTPATPLPALSLETSSTMQLSVTVETDNPQLIYHHNDNCEGDPDDVDDDRGAFSSFVNSLINYDHLLSQPDDIEHDNNNVTTPEPAPQSGSLLHPSFNTMLVSSYGTAARSRGGSLYYHYDDDDDNIPSPGHFDDAEHVRSTSLTHLHCMSVSPTASNSR